MLVAEQLYTAEDLLKLELDDSIKVELVEGEMITMPPAGTEHSFVSSDLIALIHAFDREHKLGGRVTGEQGGYQLTSNPDTVRAPDVGYISKSRLHLLTGTYFQGAPDLAVEIVSPSDSAAELLKKIAEYLEHGSRLVWAFYPTLRQVVVHTAEGAKTLKETDTLEGGDVLPGFSVPLQDIFAVLEINNNDDA
jgi:Uma2 family endonuclease